jgi:hypothetical protein
MVGVGNIVGFVVGVGLFVAVGEKGVVVTRVAVGDERGTLTKIGVVAGCVGVGVDVGGSVAIEVGDGGLGEVGVVGVKINWATLEVGERVFSPHQIELHQISSHRAMPNIKAPQRPTQPYWLVFRVRGPRGCFPRRAVNTNKGPSKTIRKGKRIINKRELPTLRIPTPLAKVPISLRCHFSMYCEQAKSQVRAWFLPQK